MLVDTEAKLGGADSQGLCVWLCRWYGVPPPVSPPTPQLFSPFPTTSLFQWLSCPQTSMFKALFVSSWSL